MNINEIKAQEAREEVQKQVFNCSLDRLEQFANGELYPGTNYGLREDLKLFIDNYKLQEQYVKHLEQDKKNMKKIINILCDTISQLI